MEIRFQTKEESNRERQEAFLKLSPGERFMTFLELSRRVMQFPTTATRDYKDNFVIIPPGMIQQWKKNIDDFIRLANQHGVRMLMVGGGAELSWLPATFSRRRLLDRCGRG